MPSMYEDNGYFALTRNIFTKLVLTVETPPLQIDEEIRLFNHRWRSFKEASGGLNSVYIKVDDCDTHTATQFRVENNNKRDYEDTDGNCISRKKMKKLRKIMRRPVKEEQQNGRSGEICVNATCPNPLGGKCVYQLCKKCCRNKCFDEDLDCKGHRILVRTRREMAKKYAEQNLTEVQCNNESEP